MKEAYFMVFDVGTGAGRVVIFDGLGQLVGKSYREWNYINNDYGLEFSVDKFWRILDGCVRDVIQKSEINPKEITAISSTSQRQGIVLYDQKGKVLYAGPNLDSRGENYNRKFAEEFGKEIYIKTGHWPEYFFAPGRIHWFMENQPVIFNSIDRMLMLNDWILYELTGRMYSEPTNASETLLYNLKTNHWDEELLDKMSIPLDILNVVKSPGELCGYLKSDLAKEWGLSFDTPVIIGAADTQSALLGSGLFKTNELGIVAGSTAPVQLILDEPIIDKEMRTWTSAFILEGKYVIEANARPTGLLLRWIRDSFYSYSHQPTNRAFEMMENEARSIPPGSFGVKAFMGPLISNVKDKSINNMRLIFGLPNDFFSKSGRCILSRSAIENVAFAIKGNIDLLKNITDIRPTKLVMTGGNTNNQLLLEILSSLLDYDLYVTKQDETTALGAAICAAIGIGYYPNLETAVKNMASKVMVIKKNKEWKERYSEIYQNWLDNYHKLRSDFK